MNYITYIKYLCCPFYYFYTYFYPTIHFTDEIVNIIFECPIILHKEFELTNTTNTWLDLNSNDIYNLSNKLISKIYEKLKELDYEDFYNKLEYSSKQFYAYQILWFFKMSLLHHYSETNYIFNICKLNESIKIKNFIEWRRPLLHKNTIQDFLNHFLKKNDGTYIDKNTKNIEEIEFLKKKYYNLLEEIIDKNTDYMLIFYKSLRLMVGKMIIDEIIETI